jgi:NAD(P)-dependent dehydrogenase (short-subunit alcohol dehydrogenase family)
MKPIVDMSLADFMEPFLINNAGTFLCCREILNKSMLPRGTGAIVTFSSEGAKRPSPTGGRLAASKAGIIGFTQALAGDVGRQGVRANCICPGAIMTDRLEAFFNHLVQSTGRSFDDVTKQYVDRTALGRLATSQEVANVALFLCSDEASGMTGQAINVGAGAVMH